jgi:phosphoglucosamine mutase
MIMGKLFGTDGVRGEANRYPMNAEIAFAIGQAVVYILKKEHDRPRIVIGKDTRISGYMLESSLEAGITSMGGNPYLVGVLPTSGIAFVAQSMRADAGIVISASHNPTKDNGIKIFPATASSCRMSRKRLERSDVEYRFTNWSRP